MTPILELQMSRLRPSPGRNSPSLMAASSACACALCVAACAAIDAHSAGSAPSCAPAACCSSCGAGGLSLTTAGDNGTGTVAAEEHMAPIARVSGTVALARARVCGFGARVFSAFPLQRSKRRHAAFEGGPCLLSQAPLTQARLWVIITLLFNSLSAEVCRPPLGRRGAQPQLRSRDRRRRRFRCSYRRRKLGGGSQRLSSRRHDHRRSRRHDRRRGHRHDRRRGHRLSRARRRGQSGVAPPHTRSR